MPGQRRPPLFHSGRGHSVQVAVVSRRTSDATRAKPPAAASVMAKEGARVIVATTRSSMQIDAVTLVAFAGRALARLSLARKAARSE